MDHYLLDMEILRQQEEEKMDSVVVEAKKQIESPYQSAHQEAMGQMASMFQDLDEIFLKIAMEEDVDFY